MKIIKYLFGEASFTLLLSSTLTGLMRLPSTLLTLVLLTSGSALASPTTIDFGNGAGKIGQWWGSGTVTEDAISVDQTNVSNGMAGFHTLQFSQDWGAISLEASLQVRIRVNTTNQNNTLRITLQDGQGRKDRWYFNLASAPKESWQLLNSNTPLGNPDDGVLDVNLADIREIDFVTEWIRNDATVAYEVDQLDATAINNDETPANAIDFGSAAGKAGQWWGQGTVLEDSIEVDVANANNGMAGFHTTIFDMNWANAEPNNKIIARVKKLANSQHTALRITLQDKTGKKDRWYVDVSNIPTDTWTIVETDTALNAPNDGTLDLDLSQLSEFDVVSRWTHNNVDVAYEFDYISVNNSDEPPANELPENLTPGNWTLSWNDEFDGPENARPADHWFYFDGWEVGSWRDADYLESEAYLDGDGHLVLRARVENGRVKTAYIQTYDWPVDSSQWTTFGPGNGLYIETAARFDDFHGGGLWTAFWLFAPNQTYDGDPSTGTEIDIMENVLGYGNNGTWVENLPGGNLLNHINVANHWGPSLSNLLDMGARGINLRDGNYHRFGLEWHADRLIYYINGEPVWEVTEGVATSDRQALILSIEYDEGPDDAWEINEYISNYFSSLPSHVRYDYVRVYAR